MNTNNNKNKMSAKQRGLLGAILGLIIMAVFLFFLDQWGIANGKYVDRTRYLGMLAVAPLYGFGYAFGYKKMAGWFAQALHYSGSIMGFAFIWWVLTGSKKGFLRGFFLIMVIFGMVAGAAWLPGIPMGIREIRKESLLAKAASKISNTTPSKPDFSFKRAKEGAKKTRTNANTSYEASEAHPLYPDQAYDSRSVNEPVLSSASSVQSAPAAQPAPSPAVPISLPGSKLLCFGGEFAGGSFDLTDGKELVIGRDPGRSNIVIPGSDVSRAHCMVRYNAAEKCAQVMDISSNGTSLLDGTPIPKNQFVKVESGNGIRIGANGPVFLFS